MDLPPLIKIRCASVACGFYRFQRTNVFTLDAVVLSHDLAYSLEARISGTAPGYHSDSSQCSTAPQVIGMP